MPPLLGYCVRKELFIPNIAPFALLAVAQLHATTVATLVYADVSIG